MNYRYEQSGNTVSDTLSLTEWREDCAIVRVRFGNGQIIIDGDKHSARDGDYFVLRPFVLYSFHSDGNPFAAELFGIFGILCKHLFELLFLLADGRALIFPIAFVACDVKKIVVEVHIFFPDYIFRGRNDF